MRKIFTLALLASGTLAFAQTFPVVDLRVTGEKSNRINLVILPDGYTSAQLDRFVNNADTIRKNAFKYTPLKEYVDFFNAYCIRVPSIDSGVNHPKTAPDCGAEPVQVADNYFGSVFDNAGTHRALVIGKGAKVSSVLASNLPDYDIAFVLSNTKIYGGTGGKFATGTMHPSSVKVAVHEWGHSFAGLADEYWAGAVFASEKPNMTANKDTATVKWKNWLGYKKVGVYAYGTDTVARKWFKPHEDCMMEYLDTVLCPVCKQTFIDEIYTLVSPIDAASPDTALTVSYAATSLPFSAKLIKPIPNTFVIKWTLNGTTIPFTDTFANISGTMLASGTNELKIIVTDTTSLSRTYLPSKGYQFGTKWKIEKTVSGIINITAAQNNSKFFFSIYPNPAQKQSTFQYENFDAPSNATFRLTDISGRRIQENSVKILTGKNAFPINLSGLNSGVYFVQLNGENMTVQTRLIVE